MTFPLTYQEIFADEIELEYVETEAGDVWAMGLVSSKGELLRVVDVDTGEVCCLPMAELARVEELVRARRATDLY